MRVTFDIFKLAPGSVHWYLRGSSGVIFLNIITLLLSPQYQRSWSSHFVRSLNISEQGEEQLGHPVSKPAVHIRAS